MHILKVVTILMFASVVYSWALDDTALRNEQELHRLVAEGQRNVAGAKGKDIVMILGDSQIGKSTMANFIYGCSYGKEEDENGDIKLQMGGDVAELARRGGHGVAETLYPAVYNNTEYPIFLCDCPGFEDTKGSTVRVAQSILLEMMVTAARSIRVVAMFKQDATQGTGKPIRSLAETLNALVRFEKQESLMARTGATVASTAASLFSDKKTGPLLFICNNHEERAFTEKQIAGKLANLRKGHVSQFSKKAEEVFESEPEMVDIAKKLFTTSTPAGGAESEHAQLKSKIDRIRNHPLLKEQVENLESTWLLDLMSENNIVVINAFDGSTRTKLREHIRNIPIVEKEKFFFCRLQRCTNKI